MKIKNEFRILGMQRSGHNAIKWWIYDGFQDPRIMLNHCSLREGRGVAGVSKLKIDQRFQREKGNINLLIYNFEQANLQDSVQEKYIDKNAFHIWPSARRYAAENQLLILILRDPYNWLASLLKMKQIKSCQVSIPRYKEQLKQALGIKDYFQGYPSIILNYNKWFSEQKYREEIGAKIGIKNTGPYKTVPHSGRGSSFNSTTFNGKADQMDVLNRYKSCLKNKSYLELFKDKELVELSTQFFGFKPLET